MPIWTAPSAAHEARPLSGTCWRLVKPTATPAALKLVDDLGDYATLRDVLGNQDLLPAECRHLDHELAAPFRRRPPYKTASRFRRAASTQGVFYASESVSTAIAEVAFYFALGFVDAPEMGWPLAPTAFTAFAAAIATDHAVDLTAPPFAADAAAWTHPTDYAACQSFADTCRDAHIAAIRYRSVRDPDAGANLALLSCAAFTQPAPLDRQTWRIRINAFGIQAIRDHPEARIGFDRASFTTDPRLATIVWDRN